MLSRVVMLLPVPFFWFNFKTTTINFNFKIISAIFNFVFQNSNIRGLGEKHFSKMGLKCGFAFFLS